MKNYYQILEVSENASQEVIEKAYRVLAKKYHPDIWPKDKMYFAESKFKEITEAYNVLSNNDLRSEYDIKMGFNTSSYERYNNLYDENQKLKQELDSIKIKNESQNYSKNANNKNNNDEHQSYFKKYISNIGNLIYNETKKPPEERKKDFIAIFITIIIISILIFVFWKVPFLHKLVFP